MGQHGGKLSYFIIKNDSFYFGSELIVPSLTVTTGKQISFLYFSIKIAKQKLISQYLQISDS